ncbi:hypothetical protein D3C85_1099810 [compost metagenome]
MLAFGKAQCLQTFLGVSEQRVQLNRQVAFIQPFANPLQQRLTLNAGMFGPIGRPALFHASDAAGDGEFDIPQNGKH